MRVLLPMLCLALLAWGNGAGAASYRGRTIEAGASPDAAACVDLVKRGIDLVETLPPKLRALGGIITDLRCNPVPVKATHTTAADNTTGVYTMQSETEAKGYIVFRRGPEFQAPYHIARSLVGNGVYARWHREWVKARHDAASGAPEAKERFTYWTKIMTKTDLKAVMKAECEVLDVDYQVMQRLDADTKRLSALSKLALSRGCPN